jgi:hypothetical protein
LEDGAESQLQNRKGTNVAASIKKPIQFNKERKQLHTERALPQRLNKISFRKSSLGQQSKFGIVRCF